MFARMLTYSEPETNTIIFYNMLSLIIIIIIIAPALGVSGRAVLCAPASAACYKRQELCFVTPVFVCSA
jgi:hypothetical protein